MSSFFEIFVQLQKGFGYSAAIFFLTILFSVPLGLLICFGRMSKIKPIAWLFRIYISVMRGTPLMLQLFVVYFCPFYIFKIMLREMGDHWMFLAVIIGFSLNYAAYFAEIFRGGLLSIDKGQYEASKVLGLSRAQTMLRVIVPQMIRVTLPSIGNEAITLVKDTALVTAIALPEILHYAKGAVTRDFTTAPFVVAAVIYLLINLVVALAFQQMERRFAYAGREGGGLR